MTPGMTPGLGTVPNKNAQRHFTCQHICPELTTVCPVTRQPDFQTLTITYEPGDLLVELKSLRDYLVAFRDRETFHEELLNTVFDHFWETVKPRHVAMKLDVAVRGGITSVIQREQGKASSSPGELVTVRA